MVTVARKMRSGAAQGGMTLLETMVAVSILFAVTGGLAAVAAQETKVAREGYWRAVVMEIVDGEMEALAAGEWKEYAKGEHAYAVHARAAANLPLGRFVLTVGDKAVRLEWIPQNGAAGTHVVREVRVQ